MIVVTVLMISCHVSTSGSTKKVGAQMITSATQKVKKAARLATFDDHPAKRSKIPTRLDTSLGMRTGPSGPFRTIVVVMSNGYPISVLVKRPGALRGRLRGSQNGYQE